MRAQALAALLGDLRTIAVAGTHGKTTTTSMAAAVLERAGVDPTYVIGGELNESGSNARAGSGDIAVAEADESDGSFLLLYPGGRDRDERRGGPSGLLLTAARRSRPPSARSASGASAWSRAATTPASGA